MNRITTSAIAIAAAALLALPAGAAATVTPINGEGPATTLPAFTGSEWTAKPITATKPPQNPYMATNGNSNLHNDSWMTDSYWRAGPSGRSLVQTTNSYGSELPGLCASITFDSQGRMLTICPNLFGPRLKLINPDTLDLIAERQLPQRQCAAQVTNPSDLCVAGNIFQDYSGGGYFYLDNQGRVVVGSNDRTIKVIGLNQAGNGFTDVANYDLSSVVPLYDRFSSALPDWKGRIWFVTKPGRIGFVNPATYPAAGSIKVLNLGSPIQNSFTVTQDGIYVATDLHLYKFDAAASTIKQLWKTTYPNIGKKKPGQAGAGTGTTPTILPGNLVSITDNADPMAVVVYSTRTGRQTCRVPVFDKGSSATENSLIGFGTSTKSSLIVENNYGYDQPVSVSGGFTSKPGFTRIDVSNSGRTCKVAWRNTTDSAPSVVPKVSLSNGLIYAYTKEKTYSGDKSDAWFWTAIDASTGNRVWRRLAGVGVSKFNNNYAAMHIGPNGRLYLGLLGGIAMLRDG